MRYKRGDRVKIKNLEWYYSNSDCWGDVECGDFDFTALQMNYCGKTLEILSVCDGFYIMKDVGHHWTDEMIEGLVNEPQEKMVSLDKVCDMLYEMLSTHNINDYDYVIASAYDDVVDFVENFCKRLEE